MKKKKIIISIIFSVLTICAFIWICGCAKKYTVTYLATEGGYLSGETTQAVSAHEDTSAVAVEPIDGYYFYKWSDGDGHFVRSDKNVTSDITVTAIFKRWTFTVQYIASSYGTIQGDSIQTVNMYDKSTEVTAIPNDGYEFVGWSDNVTESTRFEESVDHNVIVYAKFEPKTYSVKFSAGTHGTIEGAREQTVKHGNDYSVVTAKPDWGYVFAGWSDGVQTATRSESVKTEINAKAYFKKGFEGGDGSVKNPFTICTYEQFCNIVFYSSEYFKLISDLDLTGINHKPLFEEDKPTTSGGQPFSLNTEDVKSFTGELDGCGYTIKNLSVNCESQYPSLFGVLGGGFIKNLSIENAIITTTDFETTGGKFYYVGILAGVLNGFAKDITVTGEIFADCLSHDGVAIGGVAGQAFFPMIDCSANINITANNIVSNSTHMTNPFCFGGLAGICSSWSVANCKAEGTITISNSEAVNNVPVIVVGGLIGYCFGNEVSDSDEEEIGATIRIVNSQSYVNVIEYNSDIAVGGFICDLTTDAVEISECSSNGTIRAKVASGFIYSVHTTRLSLIDKCRSTCNLVCVGQAVGFARIINNLTFSECYVGGNISASGYACGFFYTASRVTLKDCVVESGLYGMYACGFGYISMSETVLERCSFTGSIQCGKQGAGICFRITNTIIKNCYSSGNISVVNAENPNEILGVGGICAWSDSSDIKYCYFAGSISVETEYSSKSYLGIFVGLSRNSLISNCHALCGADSEIKNLIDNIDDATDFNIVAYAIIEDMYNIADVLNTGQEEQIWQNVNNALPEFITK